MWFQWMLESSLVDRLRCEEFVEISFFIHIWNIWCDVYSLRDNRANIDYCRKIDNRTTMNLIFSRNCPFFQRKEKTFTIFLLEYYQKQKNSDQIQHKTDEWKTCGFLFLFRGPDCSLLTLFDRHEYLFVCL